MDEKNLKKTEKAEESKQEPEKKLTSEENKTEKKAEKAKIAPKTEAVVKGASMHASTKQSMAICNFIRRKDPETALKELEQVVKMKRAMPMKGEIPHRRGMMSGRYPINASLIFIKLIKSLVANAAQTNVEKPHLIFEAYANKASKNMRKGGREEAKRTNIILKLKTRMEK